MEQQELERRAALRRANRRLGWLMAGVALLFALSFVVHTIWFRT